METQKVDDNLEWFESYDGPKNLGWEDGKFICQVGFNIAIGNCVRGYELSEVASSAISAVAAVRQRYAGILAQLRQ